MRHRTLLLTLSLGLLAVMTACGTAPTAAPPPCNMPQSQNSQAAVEIILQATCSLPAVNNCTQDELAHLSTTRTILGQRMTCGLGVSNPVVHQDGTNRIIEDFPALRNEQEAISRLTQTGEMEIIDTGTAALEVGKPVPAGSNYSVATSDGIQFTDAQLDASSVNAMIDRQSGQPVIVFQFKGAAQSAFADYTRKHIGEYLTMTLDNEVIESAVIQSAITGQAEISGSTMTLASAQEIAAVLRSGPVPTPLTIVSERSLSETTEPHSVADTLIADE